MIIYLDPYGLRASSADEFVVVDDATYVEARRRMLMRKRGLTQNRLVIVVRDVMRANWFGDVTTHSVNSRELLQARYPAVLIPADLTDADVRDLNLLGSTLIDANIEPTESALLKLYFDNRLSKHVPVSTALYSWAQFVAEQPDAFWKDYLDRKWVERIVSADEGFDKLLTPVRSRDKTTCRTLLNGIYFAGWPSLFNDWLHIETTALKAACSVTDAELRQLLEQLPQPSQQNAALENRVEQRAVDQLKTSPAAWRNWPGRYRAEIKAIIEAGSPLTEPDLAALLTTYANLLTPDLRRRLAALVPPKLSDAPAWAGLTLVQQAEAWQRWATESFIPYKFWLDELHKEKRPEEALNRMEHLSEQYANWLYTNYQTLLDRDDILSNQQVCSRVSELATTDRVIWLIIDGFPASFVPLLHDILTEQGLSQSKTEWSFAPLPTITPIGIPVLLNGLRPDAQSFIWDNNRQALKQSFIGRDVLFEGVIGRFQSALQSEADVVCLHWQDIDKLMHKPDYELETTRAEAVQQLLAPRIGQLAEHIRQSARKTRLVIATDHGATKCLRNEMGIRNPKLADIAADRPKERCVRLGGKLKPEHVDDKETRLLPGTMTHNPDDWAVAWGYQYFGTNDHGYRHGGLTPEETIVPVIVAEIAAYRFIAPRVIDSTGKELILGNREKEFTLQLVNTNDYPVLVKQLVIEQDIDCQFELPVTIESQSTLRLVAPLKLARTEKAKEGRLQLNLTITYVVKGDRHVDKNTVSVPIQSNDLDEFFDF